MRRHLSPASASKELVSFVLDKPEPVEVDCSIVRRELSDYVEADLTPQVRQQIENHLKSCQQCSAVHDGLRNVVQLLNDENAIDLPEGFSRRLYSKLFPES